MVDMSFDDIHNLSESFIDSGTFGTVYKKDNNNAYKIYHERIPNYMKDYVDNPVLTLPLSRFELLKKRSERLLYTQSITDFIMVNGKFGGVVIPYFDGELLNMFSNSSFDLKIDISKQLIRNHKELHHNLIFPYDYKLNNVIVSNNKVEIIDLDDVLTSVPRFPLPHHIIHSNFSLSKCLCSFFNESVYTFNYPIIRRKLNNTRFNLTPSINCLENQLRKKEEEHNFFIIDSSYDISSIPNDSNLRILLVYDSELSMIDVLAIMEKLKEKGLKIFDIIEREKVSLYISNFNTVSCYDYNGYNYRTKDLSKLKSLWSLPPKIPASQ